uniref:hypothetical protein n=1 Tax=Paractinoplanes polyasparticus TaxID=2856853 RepID=UPI001C84D46F|nr:hypothetical protein [Actinoplanes polyasparticus]
MLISGAGVAGPALAYWLQRYGFRPTVVERTPAERMGVGGHSVDLFGPAVDGRITLVGDAGYSPGPAVGGGTSVAMVGAYVLAGELHAAGGDHIRAFRGYEDRMHEFVRLARTIGLATMKSLIPATASQVWLMPRLIRLVTRLPVPLQRRLSALQGDPARALAAITVENYE